MKIVVDENIDEAFPEFMTGHEVVHVVELGWKGTKNGEPLTQIQSAGFQAFISSDKSMPYQQSMKGRTFPLFVLDIHPNILVNQVACIPMLQSLLPSAKAGKVYVIEGPHSKRRNVL